MNMESAITAAEPLRSAGPFYSAPEVVSLRAPERHSDFDKCVPIIKAIPGHGAVSVMHGVISR